MTPSVTAKKLINAAAVLGFLGILFGAFGAHGLKSRITSEMLTVFETGSRYHLAHALALLALGGWIPFLREQTIRWVLRLWVLGTVIFSGSLYILAITSVRQWGMVTPIGGLLLMAGWGTLFLGALQNKKTQSADLG